MNTFQKHLAAIRSGRITRSNVIGLRKAFNHIARLDAGLSGNRSSITFEQADKLNSELIRIEPKVTGELHESGLKVLRNSRYKKRLADAGTAKSNRRFPSFRAYPFRLGNAASLRAGLCGMGKGAAGCRSRSFPAGRDLSGIRLPQYSMADRLFRRAGRWAARSERKPVPVMLDPEPPCCVVCDALNPAGACCNGTWCPRESGIRKERIRKDEFNASDPMHFRLRSCGGSWRYYVRTN